MAGGRRLDFEAVSRGHSYCRTDYAISHRDPSQVTDVQNVALNTLAYLPFQGSESTYEVETWHGGTERMSGAALARLTVRLCQPRSFRLLFYRRRR